MVESGSHWLLFRKTEMGEIDPRDFETAWLQAAVQAIPDSFILVDEAGNYLKIVGGTDGALESLPTRVVGKNVRDVFDEQRADDILSFLHSVVTSDRPIVYNVSVPSSAGPHQYESRGMKTDLTINGLRVAVVVARDITRQVQDEKNIHDLSLYDKLTSLPNRRLFFDRLLHAEISCVKSRQYGAVILVDLDGLGRINESAGYSAGDEIIRLTAERLSRVSEDLTVARLGGDEFVVLLEQITSEQNVAASICEKQAERILSIFDSPFGVGSEFYFIGACVGISLFKESKATDEIMKQASTAMRSAKSVGQNAIRFFDPNLQSIVSERVKMEQELHLAINRDELCIHYQPQFDADGRIVGLEALLRWRHPQRGLLTPDVFLSAADSAGLFLQIEKWVTKSVCKQLAEWGKRAYMRDVRVSVNVSGVELYNSDFSGELIVELGRVGANPRMLTIELVESILLADVSKARHHMTRLRNEGVNFTLDDFGTGYSSLSYIQKFDLDAVKIDKSFVSGLPYDKSSVAIIRSIVALAENFNFRIVAEGVETNEQRVSLQRLGCTHFQGFLCCGALAPDDVEILVIKKNQTKIFGPNHSHLSFNQVESSFQ